MTSTRGTNDAGFALPLTIFVLMLVTVLLAALMVQVQTDRRIAESSGDVTEALIVAESGLERYIAHYDSLGLRPSDGDSLRVNVVSGYADVIANVVHQPADTTLDGIDYIIRSRGRLIHPTLGADPQAVRVVSQFAQWGYGTMKVRGAFTAVDGFRCNNCDGTYALAGNDACLQEPPVPGIWRRQGGPAPGPFIDPSERVSSISEIRDSANIDWSMVEDGGFDPDHTTLTDLNSWSSYLLAGDVTLTDITGSGLLLITGDATLAGTVFDWQGVLAVGGHVHFEADTSRVSGALLAGLTLLPQPPGTLAGTQEWGDAGTHLEVNYNSCAIRSALRSLSGFTPVPGAWIDRWASY